MGSDLSGRSVVLERVLMAAFDSLVKLNILSSPNPTLTLTMKRDVFVKMDSKDKMQKEQMMEV